MGKWQAFICVAALAFAFGAGAGHAQEVKAFPVSGKVLMPDGSPAAGATVEARSVARYTDWQVEATATSDADGKLTMQLKKGSYRIRAVSGGLVYLDQSEMIDVAMDGSLSKPIEARLGKGCKVEGSVIDSSTGRPVGGVKIITRDGDHAESSDSGAWSMVVGKRSSHAITAIKEGFFWPIVNFNASGDTAKVKVEIKPGGTIKGTVVNEQGQPVAGARIGTETTGYFRAHGAKTDADGRFALAGQDPDAKAQVSVSADGYDSLYDQPVIFPDGQREAQAEFTVKRPKIRTISGRVTRLDGSPVEGAKVAYGNGTNYVDYVSANTDKDGKYEIKDASIRGSLVMVSGKGLAPMYKPVDADKDVEMDFVVKPGHTVEGRVEDEDGKPIVGAYVTGSMMAKRTDSMREDMYSLADTKTDKDGKFKLENLPEVEAYVDVYTNGYDSLDNERLKVDKSDYTLVLRKTVPGQISGTVVRDSDGKPVPEFNVRLGFSRNGGASSSGLTFGLTEQGVSFQGADGRFTVKGLKVKEGFAVIVTAPGYMQATVDPVMVKPVSEDASDTVIRLRPASAFEGSVTAAGTGSPVGDVIVTAWDTGSYGSNVSFDWDMSNTSLKSVSTRTDASGKFKFDSMPFSSGAIMLEKQGFARTLLRQVVFSRPLQASLEKGATVAGSIADEQGKVPPGDWLNLEQVDMNLRFYTSQSKVNPDGSFKIDDLPPGEYMVMQYKDNRGARHVAFELKAGETYQVDWNKQGAVLVEGKVLQNGKPVPKAKINVNSQRRGDWSGSGETDADGSYRLSLFKPGTYFFSCMLGEWMDPNHIYSGKTLQLAVGANRVDFSLPYGSISGKLLDKLTGKPVTGASVRLYVRETYEQKMGRAGLVFAAAQPTWWPENQCKTDKNGVFQARNLRAGEWLICTDPGRIPTAVVKLADGQAKTGVVAKVPATGSARISFAGMKDKPKDAMAVCIDQFGMMHYPKYENGAYLTEYEDLPVGKVKAVVAGVSYLPTEVPFQVRADQTAKVSIKLTKGPRIVFRPKSDTGEVAETVSIGFRITTPDGKPVYRSMEGLCWGGIITHSPDRNVTAAITVKPGTYLIKAGAVRGDSRNYGDDPELTGYSGKVTVTSGRDTVVEVPLNR